MKAGTVYHLQLSEFPTMQRPIEQIYSTDEDMECERCGNNCSTFVSLTCEHKYCVLCLTFIYVKHRKYDPQEGTVKCLKCQAVTTLHPSHLQIVTKTLKQQVIPNIEGDNQLTIPKNVYGLQYSETINRKIKSEEHSFEHNVTPSTAKCFFSKCESPSSRKKGATKQSCRIHRNEPITHICFSCEMQPLCLKCSSATKKHSNHEVKDIQRGISMIVEQVSFAKMELSQKIQEVEIWERRLEDRSVIIKDRALQTLSDIRGSFENIYAKCEEKLDEVITCCKRNFDQIMERNDNQISTINSSLQILRGYHEKISRIQKDSENFDFITKWSEIKNEFNLIRPLSTEIELDTKVRFPTSAIFKDIDRILMDVSKLSVSFKNSNLSRVGTAEIEACRSESKLKKEQNKRLKTNFVSLNSSREKKKKNTKTEEDERRLRTEKINFDTDKRNSKMPAYITDFINKKGQKGVVEGSSNTLELTSPNIEGSKLTSKLSKTISPEEINRKKKDNMALIKERMERKTAQPACKTRDPSRKKKVH